MKLEATNNSFTGVRRLSYKRSPREKRIYLRYGEQVKVIKLQVILGYRRLVQVANS